MALVCYLAIPALMIVGVALSRLIGPEMARYSGDYTRNFRLLELAATGALMATTGLALLLWLASSYLVLKSRRRSVLWLALAAAGPFGFMFITMLVDRSPAPDDLYQQFIGKLKLSWRIPLEIALFVSAWTLAYQCVALKRKLLIRFESFSTGIPVETDYRPADRIQRHVRIWRRARNDLLGHTALSALAHILQYARSTLQTVNDCIY